METIRNITTRKSVRKFLDKKIPEEIVREILKAGMAGPSCVNSRPWEFLVITEKEILNQMADANGPAAEPLRGAACGILVCGDLNRAFKHAPDYWIVDASISAQNMILAAHDLGVSSVWLGTWPQMHRVEAQQKLFDLPENIIPHSILAFGYAENEENEERDLYEQVRVHYNKW